MASKKDLVEAHAFSRRRLVTAFVSGAPGGREVEPSRPGRTVVAGLALAVLVAAGGAVAGVLGAHESIDWTQPALVSDQDTFAYYVVLPTDPDRAGDGTAVLRPVTNITSAMLLLGPDLVRESVPGSAIAEQQRGAPVGILQAPTTPPTVDHLLQTGWTACTGRDADGPDGVGVTVSTDAGVRPLPGTSMVFEQGGTYYVVAETAASSDGSPARAYSYAVPAGASAGNVLQGVARTAAADALPVTPDWVALFPPGPALSADSFDLPGLGDPADAGPLRVVGGGRTRVGDYYTAGDDDPGSIRVLLAPVDGRPADTRLAPFAAAVYQSVLAPTVHRLTDAGTGSGTGADPGPDPLSLQPNAVYDTDLWPVARPTPAPPGPSCAVLGSSSAGLPTVRLGTTDPGSTSSGVDVPRGAHEAFVDPGHGALVRSAGFGRAGAAAAESQPFLVDDRGFAYSLDQDAADRLGYADVAPVTVPDTWLDLFTRGVPLSVDAARCPPTSDPTGAPCG